MRTKAKFGPHSVLVCRRLSWRVRALADVHMRKYKAMSARCKGKQEPVCNRLQVRFHKDSPGPLCPMLWTRRRI